MWFFGNILIKHPRKHSSGNLQKQEQGTKAHKNYIHHFKIKWEKNGINSLTPPLSHLQISRATNFSLKNNYDQREEETFFLLRWVIVAVAQGILIFDSTSSVTRPEKTFTRAIYIFENGLRWNLPVYIIAVCCCTLLYIAVHHCCICWCFTGNFSKHCLTKPDICQGLRGQCPCKKKSHVKFSRLKLTIFIICYTSAVLDISCYYYLRV